MYQKYQYEPRCIKSNNMNQSKLRYARTFPSECVKGGGKLTTEILPKPKV